MIPILYEAGESIFADMGFGGLPDAIDCAVTEERNGMFELSMTYPVDGLHFEDLAVDRIILAAPNDTSQWQPFRVYAIRPSLGGTAIVLAEHISYRLNHIIVAPFTAGSVTAALQGIQDNASSSCPFVFWTDKAGGGSYTQTVPASARARLAGEEGSILDIYGGEFEWDRAVVRLHQSRGADNGVVVAYGKNLTSLEQEINLASMLTGIYPYYYSQSDGTLVQLPERLLTVASNYSYPRVKAVDLTSEFDSAPTVAQLRTRAQAYINANKLTEPKVSIQVSFVALWQTAEYKDIAPLERVGLCDTVTVKFPRLGIDAKAKVVKTVYDVLQERYKSIELGDARQSLDTTIADLIKRR